jgi:F0F1-type ATP synthase membrane subunit c/vacuolar-type H+-ATPase subunit K
MTQRLSRTRRVHAAAVLAAAALALTVAGCSSGDGGSAAATVTTVAAAPRPSSQAKLTIVAPRNGQTVSQDRPEVRLGLDGGKIVSQTTTRVQGDEGHIHLHVDGKLVDMNYGLRQRLPKLPPGQHVVQVEFVAADHAPFDPRVLTQAAFEVDG